MGIRIRPWNTVVFVTPPRTLDCELCPVHDTCNGNMFVSEHENSNFQNCWTFKVIINALLISTPRSFHDSISISATIRKKKKRLSRNFIGFRIQTCYRRNFTWFIAEDSTAEDLLRTRITVTQRTGSRFSSKLMQCTLHLQIQPGQHSVQNFRLKWKNHFTYGMCSTEAKLNT